MHWQSSSRFLLTIPGYRSTVALEYHHSSVPLGWKHPSTVTASPAGLCILGCLPSTLITRPLLPFIAQPIMMAALLFFFFFFFHLLISYLNRLFSFVIIHSFLFFIFYRLIMCLSGQVSAPHGGCNNFTRRSSLVGLICFSFLKSLQLPLPPSHVLTEHLDRKSDSAVSFSAGQWTRVCLETLPFVQVWTRITVAQCLPRQILQDVGFLQYVFETFLMLIGRNVHHIQPVPC